MGYIARVYTIIVAACALMPAEANARSDWVHLGPLDWEIELEYDGRSEQRRGQGEYRRLDFSEKLELHQSGYLVSPKIFDFSVTMAPTFLQGQHSRALQEEWTRATSFDYDVNLEVLRGIIAAVDFAAGTSRNSGTYSSNLGHHTDYTLESRSLNMRWNLSAFPMAFGYKERLHDQTISSGSLAAPRRRDEFQRSVRWSAQSSKLQMQVEKRWFDDRINDNDFDALQQSVAHNFRWGKNSHLRTAQRYLNREGVNSLKLLDVSEGLRLQHFDNLYSALDYRYSSITRSGETKTHLGNYALVAGPTKNLTTTLRAEKRNSEFRSGSEILTGGGLELSYRRGIFWNGKLNLDLNGSSLQTDRKSNGTTFESLDVSHTVPATLLVLLETRAIDTGSIIVTDVTFTQVYLAGVDYIARSLSGDRTELQILTSGLIGVGDTVLVSYDAAEQPSAEFSADSVVANLSIDFNWLRFYHSSHFNKKTLKSGSFGEGQGDVRDQKTGVELKWSGAWFEASAMAEDSSYESGDYFRESLSFTQTAQVDISALTRLILSASQIFLVSDGRETNFSQWSVNLNLPPFLGMSVKPYVNGWDRREDRGQFQERLTAGVDFMWKLRKFELDVDFSHLEHVTHNSDRSEQRIFVRIVRRSR